MARIALKAAAGAALVLVLAAAGFLGYRAWRQHENAEALAIRTPNGIQEAGFVRIGGIDQWIEIRGENRANPVLLFLHGGPGGSVTPLSAIFRHWEKHFTVVLWDQRGAGKTFVRNGRDGSGEMTIARNVEDGIEVSEFLRRRLHKQKIVLLGHSWGTMLGVMMAEQRPDLFAAYVGTGQVVGIDEKEKVIYARTLAKLEAAHDAEGVAKLKNAGPPPYRSNHDLEVERDLSEAYDIPSEKNLRSTMTPVVLYAPGWSLWETYEFLEAPKFAAAALYREHLGWDARKCCMKFAIPFFIFNGAHDAITPSDLARHYFDGVQAPRKAFVLLPGGHSSVLTDPDGFLRELDRAVLPVAR